MEEGSKSGRSFLLPERAPSGGPRSTVRVENCLAAPLFGENSASQNGSDLIWMGQTGLS